MLPKRLSAVVAQELGPSSEALVLAETFLRRNRWSPEFGRALLASAREGAWELRLAAALMLEHCVLRDPEALAFVAESLPVTAELPTRLARLAPVHARIDGVRTPPAALRAFLRVVRTPCRIALARFVFTPLEVVERIFSMVETTAGIRDVIPADRKEVADETETLFRDLDPYEREIAERLRHTHCVYWVAPYTPSDLHALVEYPLGTVVLVVKPPGSDVEIELKRAGLRGAKPLDVFFGRNGNILPPTHHLRGGSSGYLLRWERDAANLLSRIYRIVHGENASMARTLAVTMITNVPVRGEAVNILRYFHDPSIYPDDYELMRRHMLGSTTSIERLREDPVYASPIELTGRFIGAANATQAIQYGNSSFRLDRVATYLGRGGAGAYFARGLERERTADEEYDLADELFEEVIPGFEAAPRRGTYGAYVAATFRKNRARADAVYLDLVAQLGTMWGTIAGARAGSEGECFVSRNIGLRARVEDDRWRVRLCFVDHDALNVSAREERDLRPRWRGRSIASDVRHVLGSRAGGKMVVGSAPMLARIYRPSAAMRAEGGRVLRAAAVAAYEKTAQAFATNRELRTLFHRTFLRRYDDWHVVLSRFIRRTAGVERWRRWTARYLRKRGYRQSLAQEYVDSIPRWAYVWKRVGFLYHARR